MQIVVLILVSLLIMVLLGVFVSFFVMLLWNYLMPEIFGLPEIGYLQAFAMYLLTSILFKSSTSSSSKG